MHMDVLIVLNAIVVILGGVLALSGLIIAQKPDAKQIIDKLTPFQALIGVGMIALSLVTVLRMLKYLTDMFKLNMMFALGLWCMIGVGIGLGALFGMGQIIKWIPGNSSAEQKALELSQKVAPYQILLGIIGAAGSVVVLLFQFKIMKMTIS
jgi:hypothetical protein